MSHKALHYNERTQTWSRRLQAEEEYSTSDDESATFVHSPKRPSSFTNIQVER